MSRTLVRLKERKAELARLREERGATDPILIIAGIAITLILLVGGSFAISGFIGNANNLNAKSDLDRVATAQAAYLAENDRYGALAVGPGISSQNTELQDSSIGFTPTDGNNIKVRTSPSGWSAVTKSGSGDLFLRTSSSTEVFQLSSDSANPQYGALQESERNYFRNPDAVNGTDLNYWSANSTAALSYVNAPWATNGRAQRATYTALGSTFGGPAPYAAPTYVSGERFTFTYKVYSTRAFNIAAPSIDQTGSTLSISQHARSTSRSVPANTPVQVWATFTATGPISASALRMHAGVSGLITNQAIEVSDLELYPGEYDASRPFFSGASAGSANTAHAWSGGTNSSISVRSVRPVIVNQPAGVTLPPGITWEQVGADVAEVQ